MQREMQEFMSKLENGKVYNVGVFGNSYYA